MSSTEYTHIDGDEYVAEEIDTGNQVAEVYGHLPHRVLQVAVSDGQIINDGTDTETVSVQVVDGLEVARGTSPSDAAVLSYNGDVTVSIDGKETTKTLNNGGLSFDITTTKSAGETIGVVAQDLTDHPAESDSATIGVIE